MSANIKQRIESANQRGAEIIVAGQPTWVDVVKLREFVADYPENLILHAGPPMDPKNASRPFRNAVSGAAVHQGLAATADEAWSMVLQGEIHLGSQQDYRGASGAAYAVAADTPVQIVENTVNGARAFCTFQEGPSGNVLRWGVYNQEVEDRLRWFDAVLAPVLQKTIRAVGGLNLRNVLARAIAMGDENHSRQLASTLLIYQPLIPALMDLDIPHATRTEVVKFLCGNERFYLHLFIAGAAAVMQGVKGIDDCTLVTAQGGNGYEFGIKASFSGDEWYTATCPICTGMYLNPNWNADVAVGYLGDSCVIETYGFGGSAAAAGPTVLRLTGGDYDDAIRRSEEFREICVTAHDWAPMPNFGFQGPAAGIDIRKVVAQNITPVIHGGMHHKDGGQAGAGSTRVPLECFTKALRALAKKYTL